MNRCGHTEPLLECPICTSRDELIAKIRDMEKRNTDLNDYNAKMIDGYQNELNIMQAKITELQSQNVELTFKVQEFDAENKDTLLKLSKLQSVVDRSHKHLRDLVVLDEAEEIRMESPASHIAMCEIIEYAKQCESK